MKINQITRIPFMIVFLVGTTLFVALNYLLKDKNIYYDATEGKHYTLSQESRDLLQEISSPVTINYYISESENLLPVNFRNYASRVEDLLANLSEASGGNLIVHKLDPLPNSDDSLKADLDGIQPVTIGVDLSVFFGLSASTLTNRSSIPFLDPKRENMLEFEVMSKIWEASRPGKKVVGIYSDLQTFSFEDNRRGRKWALIHELEKTYQVELIAKNTAKIEDRFDHIIVIHPREPKTQFLTAFENYLKNGGTASVLLDSVAVSQQFYGLPVTSDNAYSDWPELLQKIGIQFTHDQVVLDMRLRTIVDRGSGPETLNCFLQVIKEGLNQTHPITRGLSQLSFPMAGSFRSLAGSPFKFTSLFQSTIDSQLHPSKDIVNLNPYQAQKLVKNFSADTLSHPIVMLAEGTYPGSDRNSPCKLLLYGDVDFVTDPIAGEHREIQGQMVFQPVTANMSFFLSGIDYATGNEALSRIRVRPSTYRPLTRLTDLKRETEEKFHGRVSEIEEQIETLNAVSASSQRSGPETSSTAKSELNMVETNQDEIRKLRAELHFLKSSLRNEIQQLVSRYKWLNIALAPTLMILLGLIITSVRSFRSRVRPVS